MRNLILFLTRNYYLLFFLFLQSISFSLILRNNHFQRSHFLNSSNALSGEVYGIYSGITNYFGLRYQNDLLANENLILRNKIQQLLSSGHVRESIKDTIHRQQYNLVTCRVVNNSTNRAKNFLTLDAGRLQGIEKESAVIGSDGVVGIVWEVSDHFSSVMSVLHENTRIPVSIERFGENSFLVWDGRDENYALLERVPSHLDLKKGDKIITSKWSKIFPAGITVGEVSEFEKIQGNTFYSVIVKLQTDFSRLDHVYVIKNLLKEEQDQLEANTEK